MCVIKKSKFSSKIKYNFCPKKEGILANNQDFGNLCPNSAEWKFRLKNVVKIFLERLYLLF